MADNDDIRKSVAAAGDTSLNVNVEYHEDGDDLTGADLALARGSQSQDPVANQTNDVVWAFMHEYQAIRQRRENERACGNRMVHPVRVEAFEQVRPLDNNAREYGRRLTVIADEMDNVYRPQVTQLIRGWFVSLQSENTKLTFSLVWSKFKDIVTIVLESGVTWGKLLLLLMFAYETAVALYETHVPKFVRDLINMFVRYLISSSVVGWIASHGGWAAGASTLWLEYLHRRAQEVIPYAVFLVGAGFMAISAFMFWKR